MAERETVTLRGGPFHGAEVAVVWGQPLLCEGEPLEDGYAARYRPSRDERGVYTFRELDRVVARVPLSSHAHTGGVEAEQPAGEALSGDAADAGLRAADEGGQQRVQGGAVRDEAAPPTPATEEAGP